MDNRKNNFDFLRLIFASFVIITHSYPLSGIAQCDFLCQLTNGQVVFSHIGVKGFFVISGYLVFQSLERSENILDYYWKRFLRIFPALFVVLLLTVILAPFVYQSHIPFLQNKSALTYMPNNLTLYKAQSTISGVFENNPFKSTINGSLWTMPYEFTMYVLLSFLILFRNMKIVIKVILVTSFLLLLIGNIFFFQQLKHYNYVLSGQYLLDLGVFFIAGALLSIFNIEKIKMKKELFNLTINSPNIFGLF